MRCFAYRLMEHVSSLLLSYAGAACSAFFMLVLLQEANRLHANSADDAIHFDGHIAAILKRHCWNCHGDSKQEAGLTLTSFDSVNKGGSGGPVVVSGRSSASRLLQVLIESDPDKRMPPDNDPLTEREIELVKKWIDSGLRENASSNGSRKETIGFVPRSSPAGSLATAILPENLRPWVQQSVANPFPILGLAASNTAPLAAMSSLNSVEFRRMDNNESLGSVAYADGEPHVVRFSTSGAVLMVAGGKPVQNGWVTLYDVASGRQLTNLGNESDTILAADISVDEKTVAIGGSNRIIKLFSTTDGKPIATLAKHTDWLTALAYSPDGKYLVSGDRIGNIYLWDAMQGGLLLPLAEHKGSIRAFAWRSDSQVLASCGEDGTIVWWNVGKGFPIRSMTNVHPPARKPGEYGKIANGVLDICFGPGGELASCGRDGFVRVWSNEGTQLKAYSFEKQCDKLGLSTNIKPTIPLRVVISFDGKHVMSGDSAGRVVVWDLANQSQ